MNVVFRADASYRIGSGHVSRCLTLANVLGGQGVQCCFVCRYLPDSLAARIRSCAHELIWLPTALVDGADRNAVRNAHWLGTTQEEDAEQTSYALRGRRCDWVIVDHYALDFRWEQVLRETTSALMVIDDLADRRHECDLLLDQNYYADLITRYEGLLAPDTSCLLGPQYAMLHPQFVAARANSGLSQIERLFVSVGANDPFLICMKVVDSLRRAATPPSEADIVAGADTAARNAALASAEGLRGITVHGFIDNIATLMARCTLAVGAAGSSTWERCALGLPSIVIITADNQRKMAVDLAQTGIIVLLGEGSDVSPQAISGAIADLIVDPVRRSRMRRDAMNLVDGLGTYRVTKRIMEMARCTN